jgi:hypothetical protein
MKGQGKDTANIHTRRKRSIIIMEHEFETVSLKEFMMGMMNVRDRKYEQRFDIIDISTKDALSTADENIRRALAALDKRFELINEFRSQLADTQSLFARKSDVDGILTAMEKSQLKSEKAIEDRFNSITEFREQLATQQETFARKTEISQAMEAFEKAVTKTENATEKRFENVNEFRAQLSDQHTTFARKAEIDISIASLNEKIDGVISQNIRNASSGKGFNSAWVIFLSGTSLLSTLIAVAFAIVDMVSRG